MIPTTVSSSPSTATAGSSSPSTGGSGTSTTNSNSNNNSTSNNNGQQNTSSLMIGLASLILEGRAIADDEFQPPQAQPQPYRNIIALENSTALSGSVYNAHSSSSSSISGASSAISGGGGAGRQSPTVRPSTSRAASSYYDGRVINITTNPYALNSGVVGYSSAYEMAIPFGIDPYSSSSASSSAESTHQRWTQKLHQLRQASPASVGSTTYEQPVALEGRQRNASGDLELVALVMNESSSTERSFEFVRRVPLHAVAGAASPTGGNAGSASSSPGSGVEGSFLSLQSLATTCLRSGSPMDSGAGVSSANYPGYAVLSPPRNSMHSYRATPPATMPRVPYSSASVSCNIESSAHAAKSRRQLENFLNIRPPSVVSGRLPRRLCTLPNATATTAVTATTCKASTTTTNSSTYPQQGPHCDQFLRKMGLAKGEAAEAEEHLCDMSYVNITCSRWRAYCTKMEGIIGRGEPVCIEVYLGPVGHKILLEQWIITQKEKLPPPTMTLPSLCSAIRSQLYFSQISAWCDLIKKSDKTIYDTGRIIFSTPTGAAGDLATPSASATTAAAAAVTSGSVSVTPGTSPTAAIQQLTSAMLNRRPRLNIFYRIKPFDSTACFNSKPNVHNFPNVNISENCSISVCLKSLPRINGGIPKIGSLSTSAPVTSGMTPIISGEITADMQAANGSSTTSRQHNQNNAKMQSFRSNDNNEDTVDRSGGEAPLMARTDNGNSFGGSTHLAQSSKASFTNKQSSSSSTCISDATTSSNGFNNSANSFVFSNASKHKCKFSIGDQELLLDEVDGDGFDDDDSHSDAALSTGEGSMSGANSNMSHREKQLLKYRKRMLKRDKKHQQPRKPLSEMMSTESKDGCLQARNGKSQNGVCQPMDQGEEENIIAHYNNNSNSSTSNSNSNTHIEMISTGTQTPMSCCQQCGSEKAFVCLKCLRNNADDETQFFANVKSEDLDVDDMDDSASSISSSEIIHTPRNKAELLLQAIQRTPKAAKHKKQTLRSVSPSSNCISMKLQNNNHLALANGDTDSSMVVNGNSSGGSGGTAPMNGNAGCQVCKRQKTQHNFGERSNSDALENIEVEGEEDDDEDGGKGEDVNCVREEEPETKSKMLPTEPQVMREESFITSTKFTPHTSHGASGTNLSYQLVVTANCAADSDNNRHDRSCTPPNTADRNCSSENNQFKTPTSISNVQTGPEFLQSQKQTPKPNALQLTCNYRGAGDGFSSHRTDTNYPAITYLTSAAMTPSPDEQSPQKKQPHNALLLRKGLPKVNLTPIFCNPSSSSSFSFDECSTVGRSAPVPIKCTTNNQHPLMHSTSANNTAALAIDNIPVQKSYSAPTLPNSPNASLSPRFAKQAAIYKRRSRHLSDRSDRSSLGSDEQFSDEDLESGGIYSPATSPLKQRARIAASFGRLPLLGNLEESLLQKRLVPKVEVAGFKVLLGASGSFCPTQLTIPAAAYFYELHGETLSTPYVCDIRLPRKGYNVPRVGTVQATLLNPMGTVVRMFVIPYDMHDMPALHQTFIRQRILADAGRNEATENGVKMQTNPQRLHIGDGSAFRNDYNKNVGNNNESKSSSDNNNGNSNNNNNNNGNNKYRLSPNGGLHGDSNLGHFISAEHMKRLRYSIHLRFQTSRSGRLSLHTDVRLLISRRTDCDTAAAHAKGVLEAPNDLVTDTVMPANPKYSARPEYANISSGSSKI